MPKGFSDEERAHIISSLREQARQLFGTYGLRKTNVEELTHAVGISKGAFYLFYESKEALFYDILEHFEAEYRERMLGRLGDASQPAHTRLAAALYEAVTMWRSHPLFAHFGQDDMAYMARKIPPERLAANENSDVLFTERLIAFGRTVGINITATPEMMTGLLRAIVLLNLQEETIGRALFGDVIRVLIEQTTAYLLKEDAHD